MLEKITDADELQSIIYGDHLLYDTVETVIIEQTRWAVLVDTVFKRVTDGKLFIATWRKAATESQEHEYPDEAFEAEAFPVTLTQYRIKAQ